jgi:trans-2,3-dihydro-3-hydroxyanthranilate isomerase
LTINEVLSLYGRGVLTTEVLEGYALAVVPDASDLDATTMQKIAREFNLAETAFVLPATRKDCAATLRIFTPAKRGCLPLKMG